MFKTNCNISLSTETSASAQIEKQGVDFPSHIQLNKSTEYMIQWFSSHQSINDKGH